MEEEREKDRHTCIGALIIDLYTLHRDCKFELKEIDNKILSLANKLVEGKEIDTGHILEAKTDLYSAYSSEMIKELSKYAVDLVDNFADVTSTFETINQTLTEVDELNKESLSPNEKLIRTAKLLPPLINEYNRLVKEEMRLKSEGWRNFLPNLMKVELAVIGAYVVLVGGLIGIISIQNLLNMGSLFYLISLSILLYGITVIWLVYLVFKKLHLRYVIPDYINDLIKGNDEE